MEALDPIIARIAMTMGAAWACGINLYATLLVLGLMGTGGYLALPPDLQILAHPLVIGAAAVMYVVEFFADKIPAIDTGWDAVHTFIRIPAGALLAAGAVGTVDPVLAVVAAILGGGLAAGTHAAKAGSRVLINTSPEPFSNWIVSIGEDVAVVAGLWAAIKHPWLFIVLAVAFILFLAWLLPKVWRGVRAIGRRLAGLFTAETRRPAG